jgi:type IV pilus assembly protein PilO
MDRAITVKRRLILGGLVILLAADLALAGYSWHASTAVRRPMAQLAEDSHKLQLLSADIERAEKIRHDLPATITDCDRFDSGLLPASTGSSAVTSELDELARKSGVQIQSVTFAHKEIAVRNLTQVGLAASVSGDYTNIVKFMNSLQRSPNSYIVESLTLQAESQTSGSNTLRIGLNMKTYFRTAA